MAIISAPAYSFLTEDADLLSAGRLAAAPLFVNTGAGDDLVGGSSFADTINGGAGFDRINGGAGNDVLAGGAGADRVIGGSGDDSFVFYAGDLVKAADANGYPDHIVDFHGAGNGWTASRAGHAEDDNLTFFGLGAGHLELTHGAGTSLQMYAVISGAGVHVGDVLVQMADGATASLVAGDYVFR